MRKRFSALGGCPRQRVRLSAWPILLLATLLAPEAGAQRQQRALPPAQRPRQRPLDTTTERAQLETQVRRNFARLVREGVGLSNEQMRRLVPVTQRYEQQRRQLQMQERDARMSLRAIVEGGQSGDSGKVSQLLQTLIDVQKRRVQILEAEQRDLGAFMTPMQRARFMAVQEQLRRRLEQMRQRRVP